MASRKLFRDLALFGQPHFRSQQLHVNSRLRFYPVNGISGFSVLNEFSQKVKCEASRNQEFQQSVKELKDKAEELKGAKRILKTKQTTEQLYKHVDGVWSDAEATAKKVSSNMKEKLSAAREEVKERLGIAKEEFSEASTDSASREEFSEASTDSAGRDNNVKAKDSGSSSQEEYPQQKGSTDDTETIFNKFKSTAFSGSPKVSSAFERLKNVKVVDLAKKGYDILKDELNGAPTNRGKHMEPAAPPPAGERSSKTDVVIVPTKQSRWSKKWEALKEKMHGHPMLKRISNMSEPVVSKSQEIAEDMLERWETTDNPVLHKIQESFSLLEFVGEIQELVKPVLNAYMKGEVETLKKYCSSEVIERCKAEHSAYQSHGIFFDNKILHVSEVEIRETKMMGTSPIIILAFQTQQVYCVRDRNGDVTEGSKDTIQTVYYAWAMQQIDPEELGEDAIYPVWKLREMHQIGVRALI